MKQYEAVIKVMEEKAGYATLGFLNQNVFKIEECNWGTKTWGAEARRMAAQAKALLGTVAATGTRTSRVKKFNIPSFSDVLKLMERRLHSESDILT